MGNSGRKPLTELEKLQRENLLAATVGSSKRNLYGKIVAETMQKICQAEFGAKRAIARVEIEKANDSLGLKLPSEKHLVRLAHETPGKTPLPKGGAMLTTGEEMQVKRFVVELRARKFKKKSRYVPVWCSTLRRHSFRWMIRGEKNSASMDSRRGYGPGWQVESVFTRVPAKD